MAGKIESEMVKELREENKKLKKNEVELRGNLEKFQKAKDNTKEQKNIKKSEIDSLQQQLQQTNHKLDLTLSLYEVAQQKIIKYTQRKKDKRAEPILFFEWPLFFNALNVKLTSIKKDHVTPEELLHVQMICCILQNLIIMSHAEINYIFGKTRTLPVEIIQERDSLKELIKTMEITKLSLEEENLDLSTKSSILNQKLFNLERENTNLRDELNYMQSSGEITRQPEIIEENDPVNLKKFKKKTT